jgi:hypothetical protein
MPAIIDQAGRPFNVAEADGISRRHTEPTPFRTGARATSGPDGSDGGVRHAHGITSPHPYQDLLYGAKCSPSALLKKTAISPRVIGLLTQ